MTKHLYKILQTIQKKLPFLGKGCYALNCCTIAIYDQTLQLKSLQNHLQ
jgi:hypothetical protein